MCIIVPAAHRGQRRYQVSQPGIEDGRESLCGCWEPNPSLCEPLSQRSSSPLLTVFMLFIFQLFKHVLVRERGV